MIDRLKFIAALVVLYGIALFVYWFRLGGVQYQLIRDILYVSTPLVATIAGVFALTKFGTKGARAKSLLFLTCGMGCFFVGELLWNYYELVLHVKPFPSIADIFYLAAYPLLFVGLLNEIKTTRIDLSAFAPSVKFLTSLIIVLLFIIVLYFGVYQAYDAREVFLANVIAMGYGIGDLLLIIVNMFLLVMAWEFRGGKFSRIWTVLFVGFLFTLLADILFATYTDQYETQVYFYKAFLDSLWMAGYLLFAYSLFEFGFSILDETIKLRLSKNSKEVKK